MDAEQLKDDLRNGRIDVERLVDLVVMLQRQLRAAHEKIEELEKQIGQPPTPKLEQPFSMRAEEKRQAERGNKKRKRKRPMRRGRVTTAEKLARAKRTEKVFPEGVDPTQCWLSHTRPVWRIEDGKAVCVGYEVYRMGNQYGRIPGVLGRSEFGLEIVISIAYQVYVVGLSFDKVTLLMAFFQNLNLRKSQVNSLLYRLSKQWESEFDNLCTLLAHSAVVHTDETSWSINSVWAFLSDKVRLLLFGVHKDAATLKQILDPASFAGIVISDDAAVYANFTQSQKCWAHLLRKAIKLTLLAPGNAEYRSFTDRLLEIYRKACRVQRDGRLGGVGRAAKVADLDDEIVDLCGPVWILELPPLEEGPANDYRLLCNELMKLMLAQQLFVFVTAPAVEDPQGQWHPVAGTNNEAERSLRGAATDRKTGRTSKTARGARRRTVIASVLESLRPHLPRFTLWNVIDEIQQWHLLGESLFDRLRRQLNLPPPSTSLLDALIPS
jgi:transposase